CLWYIACPHTLQVEFTKQARDLLSADLDHSPTLVCETVLAVERNARLVSVFDLQNHFRCAFEVFDCGVHEPRTNPSPLVRGKNVKLEDLQGSFVNLPGRDHPDQLTVLETARIERPWIP